MSGLPVSTEEREQDQEERRCLAVTTEGTPCRVPPDLVRDDGYCLRHSPDPAAKEIARSASDRAGRTTAMRNRKRIALDPGELGRLETPADAARWCAKVGAAVAEGRLTASQAQAVTRAVSEFIRARDLHVRENKLRDLEREVERLRNGNGGGKR